MASSLPNIQQTKGPQSGEEQKSYMALLAPGPVYLPSPSIRNPILGTMATYSTYMPAPPGSTSKVIQRKPMSNFHRNMHEKSVFDHTGYQQSYFIIHPQWTSEASGIRRMRTMERSHYSWDSRPSHSHSDPPPLVDYILPQLHKKRDQDSLLRQTLQSAKAAEAKQGQAMSDRDKLLQSSLPPMQLERSHTWAPPSQPKGSTYYPSHPKGSTYYRSMRQSAFLG